MQIQVSSSNSEGECETKISQVFESKIILPAMLGKKLGVGSKTLEICDGFRGVGEGNDDDRLDRTRAQ